MRATQTGDDPELATIQLVTRRATTGWGRAVENGEVFDHGEPTIDAEVNVNDGHPAGRKR